MELIPVRKSHVLFYHRFPLYYISKEGKPVLYKEAGKTLDARMLEKNQYPEFFISKKDEAAVVDQLMGVLNLNLARVLSQKGLMSIKKVIEQIVQEVLDGPLDATTPRLPETIELIFNNAKKNPSLLESLTEIKSHGSKVVEHTMNVLTLTAHYSLSAQLSEEDVRQLCLAAMLHDIGIAQIKADVYETDEQLTDDEFKVFKTHPMEGYKKIKADPLVDKKVAAVALSHHERLDGSGYPKGISDLSFETKVISLIDSYEQLAYRDKAFRKALGPFQALQIIKNDVLNGQFSKEVFTELCSCLTR